MKQFLLNICATILFNQVMVAQLNVKTPLVCHDKDKYLACFNDGEYILHFKEGNFTHFNTADFTLRYADDLKELTFYMRDFVDPINSDTVHIKLLDNRISITKRDETLVLNSLTGREADLLKFGIGLTRANNYITGLYANSAGRQIEIKMFSYGKKWSWDIVIRHSPKIFSIVYDEYSRNRVGLIYIQDPALRYGVEITTTGASSRKISTLTSSYMDTVQLHSNGMAVMGYIPLESGYRYEYRKNGKLDAESSRGTLKLCECN